MAYAKDLLDAAAAVAGSRYALAKLTGLHESALSMAANGKRQVPASWVLKLARVAGVDPTEAMENHDLERAEKKKARLQALHSALAGAVGTCAIFTSSVAALALHQQESISRGLNSLYIVSNRARIQLFKRWHLRGFA